MKRSEMLDLINEIIAVGLCSDAEVVLKAIEDAGMLPPGYMKPIPFEEDGKQYPLVPGDFQNEAGVWCTPGVNQWEPEDV